MTEAKSSVKLFPCLKKKKKKILYATEMKPNVLKCADVLLQVIDLGKVSGMAREA